MEFVLPAPTVLLGHTWMESFFEAPTQVPSLQKCRYQTLPGDDSTTGRRILRAPLAPLPEFARTQKTCQIG